MVAATCLLLCLATCGGGPAQRLTSPQTPEIWYQHHSYLASDEAVDKSKALINQALAAGYTGMVLWDSGLDYLGSDDWPPDNEDRMREVLHYAAKKHLRVIASQASFGYSNELLERNPNWAESQPVEGTEFDVDPSGRRLVLHQSFPGLRNFNFESGREDWFDTGDAGIGLSTEKFGGQASAAVVDAPGNARFRQSFPLIPHRQYHIRLFYKSSHFRGGPMISVFDGRSIEKVLLNDTISANGDHNWTELDYTFNSGDSTSGQIYFGVWGGSQGAIFFDDITLEETAFVYLTRRAGTPLKIYEAGHPEREYREGADVKPIVDSRMLEPKAFTDQYHEPPVVTLPRGSRLKPGDRVAVDYYAAQPIPPLHSVSACMTDAGVQKWIAKNARAINHVLPKEAGLFLGYDEVRQANSCGSCRAKKMSAGELLAWSVGQTAGVYANAAPGRPLYIWSDMFDPFHNMRRDYYHVEGDLDGAWKGIPDDVTVMNWNQDHMAESLKWFAGKGHRQVFAGYYDGGDGSGSARAALTAARGIPGLQGLMYTTWRDDYSQMRQFADASKAGWAAYLESLHGQTQ